MGFQVLYCGVRAQEPYQDYSCREAVAQDGFKTLCSCLKVCGVKCQHHQAVMTVSLGFFQFSCFICGRSVVCIAYREYKPWSYQLTNICKSSFHLVPQKSQGYDHLLPTVPSLTSTGVFSLMLL